MSKPLVESMLAAGVAGLSKESTAAEARLLPVWWFRLLTDNRCTKAPRVAILIVLLLQWSSELSNAEARALAFCSVAARNLWQKRSLVRLSGVGVWWRLQVAAACNRQDIDCVELFSGKAVLSEELARVGFDVSSYDISYSVAMDLLRPSGLAPGSQLMQQASASLHTRPLLPSLMFVRV